MLWALVALAACQRTETVTAPVAEIDCDTQGFLVTEIHGGISADLDWRGDELSCEGMPRPDGDGARLRFAGPSGDAEDAGNVAFILGIPTLREGETALEAPTNVTLTAEGTGRFFSTRDTSGCWTDVDRQEAIGGVTGREYRISGTVYCVSPLPELNGGSSISFTELKFSGRLNWNPVE